LFTETESVPNLPLLVQTILMQTSLCSRPNWPYYGSCPSVCLSVPHKQLT